MKLYRSKDDCKAELHPNKRMKRYQRGTENMFYQCDVSSCTEQPDENKDEDSVPQRIAKFSHCIMDTCSAASASVSPIIIDVDGKARRKGDVVAASEVIKTGVRFALFVFVKVLVEYIVRNSTSTPCVMPEFWMCDASGKRRSKGGSSNEDEFKFSYHMVVRFPDASDCIDKCTSKTFKRSASKDLCVLLNKCMAADNITFRLAGAPEEETIELQSVMEATKTTLCAELTDADLKHGIFDDQIYKSKSLRELGSQRPSGGNELMHVDLETGKLAESIWTMNIDRRQFLQRKHDPYPSVEEMRCTASAVPFTTVPPLIVDKDEDEEGDSVENKSHTAKVMHIPSMGAKRGMSRSNVVLRGRLDAHEELAGVCTRLFKLLCSSAIPGASIPHGYVFTFRNVKICKPCYGNDNSNSAFSINLNIDNSSESSTQPMSLFEKRHHYSIQALSPYCPWKSARCCKKGCTADSAAASHNQNRVIMTVHPMTAFEKEAHVELICFSAKCVAGMADKCRKVAVARYPAEGERPSMSFTELLRKFVSIAWRAGGCGAGPN